jgi:diacylglycerol kinase family enzyme
MYFYICDNFAKKSKFSKKLEQISMKLANLGIGDERAQISLLRPIEEILKEALQDKRCTNIVAIGDDKVATQSINMIAHSGRKIAFGIIPLKYSRIAESLGMPNDLDACCQEISSRKIACVDLGKADDYYFLTSVNIKTFSEKTFGSVLKKVFKRKPPVIKLDFLEGYKVQAHVEEYSIINMPTALDMKKMEEGNIKGKINPRDGLLDVLICENEINSERKSSFLQTRKLSLETESKIEVSIDGQKMKRTSLKFKIYPKYLDIIVGKNRLF